MKKKNQRTIGKLLWLLAGFNFLILLSVEVFSNFGFRNLVSRLEDVGQKQMPAVRAMTLVDMMHDGLRAVVFRSLVGSFNKSQEDLTESLKEYDEFSQNISKYLKDIDLVVSDRKIRLLVEEATEDVERYVKSGHEIVELAAKEKSTDALRLLPEFQNSFTLLEDRLEVLGELIEGHAKISIEESSRISMKLKSWGLGVAILGTLLGMGLSYVINRSVTSRLADVSGVLNRGSLEVGEAVSDFTKVANELSSSSSEQAAALDQTASAIHEISAMVNKSAQLAGNAESSTNQSKEKAEIGSRNIIEMLNAMKSINDRTEILASQMAEGNKKLSSIVQVIDEVVQKTKVINEIVFQTKLLSFNASVEAARAGEHGKGFAVVAEEVGNLAQMSGHAAKEINSLLEQSRMTVNNIVTETKGKVETSLASAKDSVEKGNRTVELCGEVFNEITRFSFELNEMVSHITKASIESAKGIDEISKTLSQLNVATGVNAQAAKNCAQVSAKLAGQVHDLGESSETLKGMVFGEKMKSQNEIPIKTAS